METKFIFSPAQPEDAEAIYTLWQSLVGTPFCAWSIDYPANFHAKEDIQDNAIYLLRTKNNTLAAVGTIKHLTEHDNIAPWQGKNPCDLMRIGVERQLQGQGIAQHFMAQLVQCAKAKGFDSMRILVCQTNLPAIRLYEKLGAKKRGEHFSYDTDWFCLELLF
ncbi:MAG: GNAT family N-acetyltransferase [Victivallaceae bacterium]